MTKEEFYRRKAELVPGIHHRELRALCRQYENQCRRDGNIEEMIARLDELCSELVCFNHYDEAQEFFDDMLRLRKGLVLTDLKANGEAYAQLLCCKAALWADSADEALSALSKATLIYKELSLYESHRHEIKEIFSQRCNRMGKKSVISI